MATLKDCLLEGGVKGKRFRTAKPECYYTYEIVDIKLKHYGSLSNSQADLFLVARILEKDKAYNFWVDKGTGLNCLELQLALNDPLIE